MLVEKARLFATVAHAAVGQLRKYTNDPYIVHPEEVAEIVSTVTDDEVMIVASLLHDVIEDTKVTKELVAEHFGEEVAQLVDELSNVSKPEDGNRKQRKEIDRQHTAKASPKAKTIKLGDLISNLSTITQFDPEFAKIYMEEKRLLLGVLKEGDPELYRQASEIIHAYTGQA